MSAGGGMEISGEVVSGHATERLEDAVNPAEMLAKRFHEAYERLAPRFSYKTRKASAVPWEEVPEQNRDLMIAVCAELLAEGI